VSLVLAPTHLTQRLASRCLCGGFSLAWEWSCLSMREVSLSATNGHPSSMLSNQCHAVGGCALTRGTTTHRRGSFALITRGEGDCEQSELILEHWTSLASLLSLRGCGSISGLLPVSGRWGTRPQCSSLSTV